MNEPMTRRTADKDRAARRTIVDFERAVLASIEKAGCGEQPLVVGVSGGPDSTALLVALAAVRGGRSLSVSHVDHGVRSTAEREADEAFVRALCAERGLPCVVHRPRPGAASEDALRRARYGALLEGARAVGAKAVVLGHTKDDQAETVLLHLVRGAGIAGLRGMALRDPWPFPADGDAPDVVRPLLALRRSEVEAYLGARGITARNDPTNLGRRYARSRIRADVLPVLAKENPRIVEAIARAAADVRDAAELIDDLVDRAWGRVWVDAGGLDAEGLAELPAAVRRAAILRALRSLAPPGSALGADAVERVEDLLAGPAGRSADVGSGLRAVRRAADVRISPEVAEPLPTTTLSAERTLIGPWEATLENVADVAANDAWSLELTGEIAAGPIVVRARAPGDRIRLAGGTRKVQDVLVDAKVPRDDRDAIPIVCGGDGRIVWVAGVRADPAAVRERGRGTRLRFRRRDVSPMR